MIRTLIIEDEEFAAQRLERLLKETEPDIEVIAKLESVEASVQWLQKNKHPDLLMLDIQLADGQSFDIFKKVKVDCFVIFATAYDEYAIKAFELNSIDYLLKPIDRGKLTASIEKYKRLHNSRSATLNINSIIEAIELKKSSFKKRFAISIGTKIKSVETIAIAFFYSVEKSTFLGTFEGHEYPVDFSLDRLETMLDPELFFRINRQFIVNYNAIQKIHLVSKSRIELDIQGYKERISVSTARTHAFRLWIDK
jgi:two-component system, LytTR family, response regulator LytT